MRNKYFICRLIAIIVTSQSYVLSANAQTVADMPKVVPASPTAAALGLYGNIPISFYTGLPDISIPVWTLKGKEISLPIGMSYRASGVKVEDIGSWVGLGWSLDCGGVITRNIKGNADFRYQRATLPIPTAYPAIYNTLSNLNLMQGNLDFEPDIFYYNFNGKSGSFVFDDQGIPHFNQFDDIKVEYSYAYNATMGRNLVQFKITTNDGTQYYFNDKEITSTSNGEPTSWYLTQIVSPSGAEIFNFVYDDENYFYRLAQRDQEYISLTDPGRRITGDNSGYNISGKRLREINTNSCGKIKFVANTTPRSDLSLNSYALQEIQIFNSSNSLLRRFDLQMENIETSNRLSASNQIYGISEYLNWRMYLKSFTESDSTGTLSKAPYVFKYYGRDVNGRDSLPHRVSFAQDHWGYYNGKNYNESLVPGYIGPFGFTDPEFDAYGNACTQIGRYGDIVDTALSGDRTPAFPYMQKGTLHTIQYPTGGITEFTYEPHHGLFTDQQVLNNYIGIIGGLRIKSVTTYDNCGGILNKKEYEYAEGGIMNYPKYRTYVYNNGGDPSPFAECPDPVSILNGLVYNAALYLKIGSGSFTVPGSTHGADIGYGRVTEIERGNGSTDYKYTDPLIYPNNNNNMLKYFFADSLIQHTYGEQDLGLSYFTWPYQSQKNNDWERGLLTNKTIYDAGGKSIHSENYLYNMSELGTVPALSGIKPLYPAVNSGVKYGDAYLFAEYQVPYGWSSLAQKTVSEFSPDGKSYAEQTVTNYAYEPQFKYKQSETITDSKGDSYTTNYTYPFNYNTAPYTAMAVRHIIGPVVETKTFKNSIELSTLTKSHKDWFNNQTVFAPELIQTKKGAGGTLENRLHYYGLNTDGNVLAVAKESGSPSSYIWDYHGVYPIAEVRNAANTDIAYTSFEADGQGNWAFGSGIVGDATALTGQFSYALNGSNSIVKTDLSVTQTYIISYWSKNGSYNVNSAPAITGRSVNGWTYYEHHISGASSVSITGAGSIDEVRLYPQGALMSSYCFRPSVGVATADDERNSIVYYDYDGLGRLTLMRDQDKNILKALTYNYNTTGQVNCNQTVYYNTVQSQSFVKSGCSVDAVAPFYTIPAKTFSSFISQADADQKALALITKYGQVYVNNHAFCTWLNDDESGYYTSTTCASGYVPGSYYVSIPAGKYSSTLSKQDANNQGLTYAGEQANEFGCIVAPPSVITLIPSNPSGVTNFKIKLVNDQTAVQYVFDMPQVITGSIGQVPPGSYTVTMYNPYGNTTSYTFGIGGFTTTDTSASFVSVYLNTSNVIVSISLP